MARIACLVFLFASLVGCGSSEPASVVVVGNPNELALLTGEWSGTYGSTATGRSGSIVFHLLEEVGHGDVVMAPLPRIHPRTPDRRGSAIDVGDSDPAVVINIREVRVADGVISGELEPYFVPNEGLIVGTAFRGTIDGDKIAGTFTMHSGRVAPLTGTWSVRRQTRKTVITEQE